MTPGVVAPRSTGQDRRVTAPRIIVVGAGIVGLTTAVRLAEAGHDVAVIARDLPLETTSATAAALWYPYRAGDSASVLGWARESFDVYADEAERPDSGVRLLDGLELRLDHSRPWFVDALPAAAAFAHFTDVPAGYREGWQLRLPVIEPTGYLTRLQQRLAELGGTITRMALSRLPEDVVVVNCGGLASRSLAADLTVYPVRGQVVRLSQVSGLDAWLLDQTEEENPVYVVPRIADIIVGGTATAHDFDQTPHASITGQILERATRLIPQLADATILGSKVGLRPARESVRLEIESTRAGGTVVHNYGHGGAGWTLAWGCANAVVELVSPRESATVGAPERSGSVPRSGS